MVAHVVKKPHLIVAPRVTKVMLLSLILLLAITAVKFQYPWLSHAKKVMTDFDSFYVAGLLYWQGKLYDAYHFPRLFEAQQQLTGAGSFMPWTYPPPFNLVTAGLAIMPIGVSYCIFTGATFIAYVIVLRQIAGELTGSVLLAIFPVLALNIRSGQNGFLTGTLIGLFLLRYIRSGSGDGVSLGLMIFKPHLAVGGAVLLLAGGRWQRVFMAAATSLVLLVVSTSVFGIEIWKAFLVGANEARQFLTLGFYPLFRMTSLYATLKSVEVPTVICFGAQSLLAMAACAVIVAAARRWKDRRNIAALAAFCSLLVSPYSYDYDLTILGIAAAMLMPALHERAGQGSFWAMTGLCWIATGYGLALSFHNEQVGSRLTPEQAISPVMGDYSPPSIGSIALLALAVLVVSSLRASPASGPPPGLPDRASMPE